ncbi:hypothetical protein RIF29_41814 [Crotalaria pallida]|uniref:Myb-like domain-containing protein n=1 Tax=Crotalaria pallida TaxID=3830 RepID=A0AAN9E735_CROPI
MEEDPTTRDMIIDMIPPPQPNHHHHLILADSDDEPSPSPSPPPEIRAPKKRAETWVQDETRTLIALRRETDALFNTSKSNKHLWAQISAKMRSKGFDRSPTMCTDKWRNLLKEFKKAKHHDKRGSGSGAKMNYYKEIEEILRERGKKPSSSVQHHYNKSPNPASNNNNNNNHKIDSFMQFVDKGMEDTNISFGPVEGSDTDDSALEQGELRFISCSVLPVVGIMTDHDLNHVILMNLTTPLEPSTGRPTLKLERSLDHDGHPLALTAADAVGANGVPPWNWRETPANGEEDQSSCGRVISVKWGDYTRRVGIDGAPEAIKEAIKAAFRLRTKRAFWLEDEDQIVRAIDRDMPLGCYTLHLDEGLAIKVCLYDESDHIPVHTEDKIFYSELDYHDFLTRRGWTCLREFDSFRHIDNLDDLRPGAIYRGVSLNAGAL